MEIVNIPVLDFNGQKIREEEVSNFFRISPINNTLIWEVITSNLSAIRQGTHKTKTRGEVRGGGKKPWKQKGTGRARAGSIRSPIWVGGGTVFGPSPRDYTKNVPQKKKKKATQHIFADKIQKNQVVLLNSIESLQISTSLFNKKIYHIIENSPFFKKVFPKKVSIKSNKGKKKVIIVIDKTSKEFLLSSKNIPWLNCINVDCLGSLHLFYNNGIIITTESLKKLEARLKI